MHIHHISPRSLRDLIGRDALTVEEQRQMRKDAARRVQMRRRIRQEWPGCPFDLIDCGEQQLRNIASSRNINMDDLT